MGQMLNRTDGTTALSCLSCLCDKKLHD